MLMALIDPRLVFKVAIVIVLLFFLYTYTITLSVIGVFLIVSSSFRINVEKIKLDDLESHNVTLLNILYLSLLHVRDLSITAHTTNNTLILSDRYNPLIHFPLVFSGIARIVKVNGEFRLGLSEKFLKSLRIVTDKLEYNTCFPKVLHDSIIVVKDLKPARYSNS